MSRSLPNEFEPYDEGEYIKGVSAPISIGRGRTLPSSHGSSGSIGSENIDAVAPHQVDNDDDDVASDTATTGGSRCTTSKILLVTTAFLLLFSSGLLGGLIASGTFSRDAVVPSSNNGNQTTTLEGTNEPTTAPSSAISVEAAPTLKPTTSPTESPTELTADVTRIPINAEPVSNVFPDGTYNYRAYSEYLVGVYYYPWHGDDFHRGGGYMRRDVVPRQYPSLGEYDDTDPQVIAEHMKMFRRANIGLLVTSWWGPNKREDNTTKDVLLKHQDIGNLKVALFYETARLGENYTVIGTAKTDIEHMCDHYFDHPNYYKIDGRPVVFIYLARTMNLRGALENSLLTMRSEAAKRGHNIFLVGDYSYGDSPTVTKEEPYIPFWYLDAVTNYDVYGSSGRPQGHAGYTGVSLYYAKQAGWKEAASKENCRYIPSVSPGYNDRGVRLENDHPALSRRLTAETEEGSLFYYQLKHAKELVDPQMEKLIMVNSFNEWHEDTQIEPVAVADSAVWPPTMTQDLEYVGYGNLYLDILGASTVSEHGQGIFDDFYGF